MQCRFAAFFRRNGASIKMQKYLVGISLRKKVHTYTTLCSYLRSYEGFYPCSFKSNNNSATL